MLNTRTDIGFEILRRDQVNVGAEDGFDILGRHPPCHGTLSNVPCCVDEAIGAGQAVGGTKARWVWVPNVRFSVITQTWSRPFLLAW